LVGTVALISSHRTGFGCLSSERQNGNSIITRSALLAAIHPRYWLRRRKLRLVSGLVLFVYVAGHLINHALGLVSLSAAERGLAVAVGFWHWWPASILLYSSAAIHVALAFYALYERRTLRLPAIEWLRIILGFGMPILLIGHVISTRAAFEVYQLAPEYGRVIQGLWSSGNEWLQLGLLAPGWIHGCLGLHIAFGHRRFYRQVFMLWFSVALLLPVLSALGFLMMSKEVIAAPPAAVNPRDGIASLRQSALATYLLMFALLLAARSLRGWREHRRRGLVLIKLPERSFAMPKGWTVLEGLRSQGIGHLSVCGGRGRCSTCRIRIESGLPDCPQPVGVERDLLLKTGDRRDVRLACQLRPVGDLTIAPLFALPDERSKLEPAARRGQATAGPSTELDGVLLLIRFEATPSNIEILPDDAWYLLQQLTASIEGPLKPLRANVAECGPNYLLVRFEGSMDGVTWATDLLVCVERVEQTLRSLESRLALELGRPLRWRVYLHSGVTRLGELPLRDSRPALLLGETANVLRQAAQERSDSAARLLISGTALDVLGLSRKPSRADRETGFFAFDSIRNARLAV
jgi:adenylate cyclase